LPIALCLCIVLLQDSKQAPPPPIEGSLNDIANVSGIGRTKTWKVAGALRAAGLFLKSSPGPAKARHLEAAHLGNLVLGLAVTQDDAHELAADRVEGLNAVIQIDGYGGSRPGLRFGTALVEMIDLAACDMGFRNRVWVHDGALIQIAPTQRPGAEIAFGPASGRYYAADEDALRIAFLMHDRGGGITSVPLIHGRVIHAVAGILSDFRAAQATLESESGASSPKETPPPTRPSEENIVETSRTNDRSLDSRVETTSGADATANFSAAGGSFPFLIGAHRYEMPPHRCPQGAQDPIR
jgi:hypothetical protein